MTTLAKLVAMLALASPIAAQAQAQIDVDNLIVGTPSQGRMVSTAFAGGMMQTWTAGISGRLTQIDMFTMAYYNGSPAPDASERAVLEIYDAGSFGTTPLPQDIATATLLGTASLPMNGRPNGSQVSAVQSFLLSSLNIDVQQNQRLAFRMLAACSPCNSNASLWVNWTFLEGAPFINSNNYAGGEHFNPVGAPGLYGQTGADLNFRTHVDPSAGGAIPEPASWALLIAGFGFTGAMARRRRQILRVVAA